MIKKGLFKLLWGLTLVITTASISLNANALSDREVEKTLEKLMKDNAELRKEVEKLKSDGSPLVEKKITKLNKKSTKRFASLKRLVDKQNDRLIINGFLSAGGIYSNKDAETGLFKFSDTLNFSDDTVLGMQMTYKLSEDTDVVTQFVAHGYDSFNLSAEWAFVRHKFSDWYSMRVGRIRIPNYLFSEVLEVGFAYPWVRPPAELYTTRISALEGVDALFRANWNDWSILTQLYGGTSRVETAERNGVEGKDVFGLNVTASSGAWTLRASTFNQNTIVDINETEIGGTITFVNVGEITDHVKFHSIGGMYDDGEYLAILELGKTDSRTGNFRGDSEKANLTLGYYWGRWTPYYTYGREYSINDAKLRGGFQVPFVDYKDHTVGIRYNVNTKTSLKFEWNHYYEIDQSNNPAETRINSGPFENDVGEQVDIYSIMLDTVF